MTNTKRVVDMDIFMILFTHKTKNKFRIFMYYNLKWLVINLGLLNFV